MRSPTPWERGMQPGAADTVGMRRDVVSAGLSMVLGAGDLLEMGLQDETATVICRQAYQDLLHGLLDAALASEAEGPDPGRTEAGRPVRPGHMNRSCSVQSAFALRAWQWGS